MAISFCHWGGDLFLSLGGHIFFSKYLGAKWHLRLALINYWSDKLKQTTFLAIFLNILHWRVNRPLHTPQSPSLLFNPEAPWSLVQRISFIMICVFCELCAMFYIILIYISNLYIAEQDIRHYHKPVSNFFLQLVLHVGLQLRWSLKTYIY